jgi:hypothetical protein
MSKTSKVKKEIRRLPVIGKPQIYHQFNIPIWLKSAKMVIVLLPKKMKSQSPAMLACKTSIQNWKIGNFTPTFTACLFPAKGLLQTHKT